ncbi:MAG: MFS transporter [Clostridia bacterium]
MAKGDFLNSKAVNGVKNMAVTVVKEWSVPGRGNYVPNKEILAFAGGGMGVKGLIGLLQFFSLNVGQWLIGLVYGIDPLNLFILTLVSNVLCILKAPIASWLIDNTHTQMGKFRPYFLLAGVPSLIGVLCLVFAVPLDATQLVKTILIGVFYNIYVISQQIYLNAYTGLSQVITPKSGERNKILSLSEFLANLGPSILQLFVPMFIGFFGGMGSITAYRVVLPIFGILCFLLGLVVMFFTKERVVLPKIAKTRVKLIEGFRIVGTNRDFWIVALSRLFYGFKGGVSMILPWLVYYSLGLGAKEAGALQGTLMTIVSTGFIPGMLLAPIMMKKMGSGKAIFTSFMMNAIAALVMLFSYKNATVGIVFFSIALWLFNFASGPQYVMQTAITADSLDEIQYQKGARVEAFATNLQQMFEIIGGTLSALVMMLIYTNFGLAAISSGEGYFDAFTNPEIRNPIIMWVIICSIIASVCCAVPFLFTKMTRSKHDGIIVELEKRKFYEDRKDYGFTEEEMAILYQGYLNEIENETKKRAVALDKTQFITIPEMRTWTAEKREIAYESYFAMRTEWASYVDNFEAKRKFAEAHAEEKWDGNALDKAFSQFVLEKAAADAQFESDLARLQAEEAETAIVLADAKEKSDFYESKKSLNLGQDEMDKLFAEYLIEKQRHLDAIEAEKTAFFAEKRAEKEDITDKEIEKEYEDFLVEKDKAAKLAALQKVKADKKSKKK